MLRQIIDWSVRNRLIVLLFTVGGGRRWHLGASSARRSRRCPT